MSTPTQSHTPSATKKATGHVSTPSHLGQSSPAPRSVPSPAATRKDHAGKTPMSHATTGSSSQGTKTLAGTPMARQISRDGVAAAANTTSPTPNMLMSFGTPAGLGVDLGTPGQMLGMSTPSVAGGGGGGGGGGGVGSAPAMNLSMSELGLTVSGGSGGGLLSGTGTGAGGVGKRDEDEERRARMRKVLRCIGVPKGRVSEEGIARVSRRVGFANDIDAEKLSRDELERKVGNRSFSLAGNTVVVDVALENHVPRSVQVVFSVDDDTLARQGEQAGRVLLGDLTPRQSLPGAGDEYVALDTSLDRFARNLERLARLDRISSDRISCFAAIAGVYKSLKRLYDQELEAARTIVAAAGDDDDRVEREVVRRKSGKTTANARGSLGTTLEYWRDWSSPSSSSSRGGHDNMEIDGEQETKTQRPRPSDGYQVYAMRIEAEHSDPQLYPPLRTSDAWLPDPLQLPPDGLPWQEPPPTYLAPALEDGVTDAMAVDGRQQHLLPDLRFVAKLEPPVVMPWQTASNLLSTLGMPQPPLIHAPYHHLLLTPDSLHLNQQHTKRPIFAAEQEVLSAYDGHKARVRLTYNMYAPKLEYAYSLEEIPFSHPRQLIELLPALRQWALTGILVTSAFGGGSTMTTDEGKTGDQLIQEIDLDVECLPPAAGTDTVGVTLATSPNPTFALTFRKPGQEGDVVPSPADVTVQILPNAEIEVSEQNLVEDDADGTHVKRMARALDVAGDLGVWIEWLKARYAS